MSNSKRNLIWIDTTTGTWGLVEHDQGSLVIVDLDAQAQLDTQGGFKPEHDADSLLAFLEGGSDSEIMQYGMDVGRPVFTGEVEVDNDGQYIMYTGEYDPDFNGHTAT